MRLSVKQRSAGIQVPGTWQATYFIVAAQCDTAKNRSYTELKGPLDMDALRWSHWALLERHEALRTVFKAQANGHLPLLLVQPMSEKLRLFSLEVAGSKQASRDIAWHAVKQDYDPATGALPRMKVIREQHAGRAVGFKALNVLYFEQHIKLR